MEKNNKNIMLSMAMVIRDSKEEADIFFQTLKENEKIIFAFYIS